jgi:NAD(P)-dependent dehydrogenase (short-subunit alcohol dehydrogenase family)
VAEDDRLAGQVLLVTGAGRNLGRTIAIEAARRGAAVGVMVRADRAAAEEVALTVTKAGGRACPLVGDVSRQADVERMMNECRAELGAISGVVHVAAYRSTQMVADITTEEWRRAIGVTLDGAWLLTRATFRDMRTAHFGRYVFLGGVTMLTGQPLGYAHVAAGKAGLQGFVRVLAREGAPHGITANIVSPATIATDSRRAEVAAATPGHEPSWFGGPISTMDEVAAPCLFLCEPVAAAITAQTISVDGVVRTREDLLQ